MKITFPVRGGVYSAFSMTIDHERIQASHDGDVASVTFQADIERTSSWETLLQGTAPVLLSLHGVLSLDQIHNSNDTGATLRPTEGLPLAIPEVGNSASLRLPFTCSRRYIEHLEDKRVAQPRRDLTLAVRLWGVVAIMGSPMVEGSGVGSLPVRFENVAATPPEQLRIPRSDWIDRFLPALGYRKTVLIELPLAGQPPVPEELHNAMQYLGEARTLRNHESYQKAVQACRQATDALLGAGPEKKAWCQTHLAPLIGAEKARMVDDSLLALRPLLNKTSHGYAPVEVDRDAADYAIESLAVALNYIARTLA